jgi:hypothetical protein
MNFKINMLIYGNVGRGTIVYVVRLYHNVIYLK